MFEDSGEGHFNPFQELQKMALRGIRQQAETGERKTLSFHELFVRNHELYRRALKQYYDLKMKKFSFKEGDFVVWKPFMRSCTVPFVGVPAIVLNVLPEPIVDTHEKDHHSAKYRKYVDIVLGMIVSHDEDEPIISYYFDSQEFAPFDYTAPEGEIDALKEILVLMKDASEKWKRQEMERIQGT